MSVTSVNLRREKSFEAVDAMSPALRQCVHEYGYAIVNACVVAGVKSPTDIHHLVREIWEGARQPRQTRRRAGTLDWLLLQAGAQIGAAELSRVLLNNNLAIMSLEPTAAMIAASMREVSGGTLRITKQEKHLRRLRAALRAGATYIKPSQAVSA